MARSLDLSGTGTRAAFVSYTIGDGESITEFGFQTDINSFETEVDNIVYANGFTLTGKAITHAYIDIIRADARYDAQVTIVVITDGLSFDDVQTPSDKLRAVEIDMFAVGIKNYDLTQLQQIASQPYSDYLYTVPEFDQLNEITLKFTSAVCDQQIRQYNHSFVPDYAACYQDPCLNGGECINGIDFTDYTCVCDPTGDYTGTNCEIPIPCNFNPCNPNNPNATESCANSEDYLTYTCYCSADFTGSTCEVYNACQFYPGELCDNLGYCYNSGDVNTTDVTINGVSTTVEMTGFSCGCREFYTGETCEISYEPCTGYPSYNATNAATNPYPYYPCRGKSTCQDTDPDTGLPMVYESADQYGNTMNLTDYTCVCGQDELTNQTFIGKRCDVLPISYCDWFAPYCQNNGTCVSDLTGTISTCECDPFWTGERCEIPYDCDSLPCENNGVCVPAIADKTLNNGTILEVDGTPIDLVTLLELLANIDNSGSGVGNSGSGGTIISGSGSGSAGSSGGFSGGARALYRASSFESANTVDVITRESAFDQDIDSECYDNCVMFEPDVFNDGINMCDMFNCGEQWEDGCEARCSGATGTFVACDVLYETGICKPEDSSASPKSLVSIVSAIMKRFNLNS